MTIAQKRSRNEGQQRRYSEWLSCNDPVCDGCNIYTLEQIMEWLSNIIHAYEKLCKYSGYVGVTDEEPTKEEEF